MMTNTSDISLDMICIFVMRNLFLLLFLILSLVPVCQTNPKITTSKTPRASILNIDTNNIPTVDKLLGLPASLTVATCDIVLSGKGYIFKVPYEKSATGKLPLAACNFIKKAHPGDEIIFEEIFVTKEGRQLRLADRIFIIP